MSKYKPATFQPTVRPDWAGILSYISPEEKSEIFEAIIKYPTKECESKFWLETVKPDLDLQYETFVARCEAKSRGVRNRWAKTSITPLKDIYKTSIRDDIVSEEEEEEEEERIEEEKREEKNKEFLNEFEIFWKEYPKQRAGNKQKAYTSYCRAIKEKRTTVDDLLKSVIAYKQSDEVKKGFAKGCQAWLNDDRFNVEYNVEENQFSHWSKW